MKIAFVCGGVVAYPPLGYGGIELGVWNYQRVLQKLGHEVQVVNVMKGPMPWRRLQIVRQLNAGAPDWVHIKVSKFFKLTRWLRCPQVVLQDQSPDAFFADYAQIHRALREKAQIICLSPRIRDNYLRAGADAARLHVIPNGLPVAEYHWAAEPKFPERSICLAVVNRRKRQHLLCGLPGLDFAGPIEDGAGFQRDHWLGEWSKETIRRHLTNYANLVLLSESEGHANACLEALACGLGLVVSEAGAQNLNTSLPFIEVIPEERIPDRDFTAAAIARNRRIARSMRAEIRSYAARNFEIEELVKRRYLPLLQALAGKR
ncbi:MAG: glycosyltransferase family 4 protein [Deltaproteobacteria bacterium]|nr:glycosyltransferase family 4 protein [Deltaproteobacteria bacterium]